MTSLKGKRILIVDDNEADRVLVSTHLRRLGCQPYQAQDGVDAVNKARLLVPDLILMDTKMPECDGYTACKILVGDPITAHVPVLFLSDFSNAEHRIRGLLAGAVDYIGKPCDFDEVRLRLMIHLRAASNDDDTQDETASEQPPGIDDLVFQSARAHLLRSIRTPPSLDDLARRVGTNRKRLNQAFKQCAGTTVYEYLREERMQEARRLLYQATMPVALIAEELGFSSSANFATAFKKRFGTSPFRFRQESARSNGTIL
ncbi:AraC family transcriptional regulator [Alcanivorax xiamenensis]|uniref:AraC family transcriptional regulator n=1 Tax=Alcanivorax xiamenensis TaxID=1177156 RepID=A0ABQ6Y3G4_9GAMM|nr:DNA-binding response regulator [Alcanivorax xiamenensis]KAF0803371.1 AraC family transcriptional regulator [Alcanivorax xiamenensis]